MENLVLSDSRCAPVDRHSATGNELGLSKQIDFVLQTTSQSQYNT